MNKSLLALIIAITVAGCASREEKQLTGTQLNTDKDGRSKVVTYVTPEEYERMTLEERQHMHAAVGASVSVPLGGRKAPSEAISDRELDKAYGK